MNTYRNIRTQKSILKYYLIPLLFGFISLLFAGLPSLRMLQRWMILYQ